MLEQPLGFTGCSSIQFYNTSPSLIHSLPRAQLVKLPVVICYLLYSACATYETLCHAISHQVLPTQLLPIGKQRTCLGVANILTMCPVTQLIYFPTKGITFQVLFIYQGLLRNIILTSHWFELNILVILYQSYVVRRVFYPLGHTPFINLCFIVRNNPQKFYIIC